MTSSARAVRGPNPRRRLASVLVAVALGLMAWPGLSAQGTQPLHKTDMIRLLTTGGLKTPDIATLVRRNCLAFQPTARDRTDLQAAGADAAVLAAVDECGRRRTPTERGVLRVATQPNVSAEAGTEANVSVQLLRGTVPQAKVPVLLKGSGAIPGGLTRDAQAVTDPRGRASFRVPVGTTAATYRLTVTLANGTPAGTGGEIELTTTAARAVRATTAPGELALWEGAPGGSVVRVTVADQYGNPAARLALQLGPVTALLAGATPARTTDERGQAAFTLAPETVRRGGEVGVFTGGARIGSFTVRLRPLVMSEERTRFVAGADQRSPVGTPLPQPLVFEVRDTSGAPVPGQSVSFSAAQGTVAPSAAPTDSSGAVRVRVTLGERAGPVVVAAKVGTIARSTTVYADPGPARELAVLHDSARVTGPLALASRKPVVLQVVARDSYGNETALANFTAVATGAAIHLKAATVTGSQGMVTLEPRRTGSGELAIRAAGHETRVPVQVTFPVAAERWVFGARGSWAGFTYEFPQLRYIHGRPGARGELFAGRAVTSQLRLELVGSLGSLEADTGAIERSVALTQGYVRGEYALLPDARVVPVVSVGGGVFRILSNDASHLVYHNSLFWLVGAGVDVPMGRGVMGEIRIETQQLNEMTSSIVNGHVGSLTVVEAGVRLSP